MNTEKREWATLVVDKFRGGRGRILNCSERGLFEQGSVYYNHNLRHFPDGVKMNVVIRISPKGRRMVQDIYVK